MNLRRFLPRLLGCGLILAGGAFALAIYPFKLSEPGVTVDIVDRRYACGECYIRFGITHVHGEQIDDPRPNMRKPESPERFEGWDVLVRYKGSETYLSAYQEKRFVRDENCAWPTFRLTGQFKRRLIYSLLYDGDHYDGIYFDANSGLAINQHSECKTLARDVKLP